MTTYHGYQSQKIENNFGSGTQGNDYVSGGNTAEEFVAKKRKLQSIFKDSGFCLTKWYSNESELFKQINEEATNERRKMLGAALEPERDVLKVDL